jgi:hypothetical protein
MADPSNFRNDANIRTPTIPLTKRTGYERFIETVKKFGGLAGLFAGGGASIPFVGYLAGITPPWPPMVTLSTALVELLALVLVFQFLRSANKTTINVIMATFAFLLLVVSSGYLYLFSRFTYVAGVSNLRFVKGFICKPDLPRIIALECPNVSLENLSLGDYEAGNFWLDWSIEVMRFGIAITWYSAFLMLSIVLGAFLVFQMRDRG